MTKVKRFFYENNHLNKGYDNTAINKNSQVKDVLPIIEEMAQYDELYPGSLHKLLDLVQKEQSYKHASDVTAIKMRQTARRLGQFFGVFIAISIGYFTLQIAYINILYAIIFSGIAFTCIFLVSLISYLKFLKLKKYRFNNKLNNNANFRKKMVVNSKSD